MRAAGTIAWRELGAWFRTPAGYVLAAMALVLNGLQLNAVAIGTSRWCDYVWHMLLETR